MSGTMDVVGYNVQALCKLISHVSYKQMYVISSFLIIDSIVPKCIIAALVLNFELTSVLLVWGPRPIFGWHTI
jgi:hypothetical protein